MASNQVVTFNPGQVPAHLQKGELSALAKALAGGAGSTGKRISVKGGVFRLYVDGKEIAAIEDRHLDVVIVNAAQKISRTFYAGAYDENNVSAPDCWSADGDTSDESAKNRQSVKCATCPQNIKGSGQGDSRACRFSQRLAVVLANDMEGDVMQLSLAATSIFGKADGDNRALQAYARWLAEQGIDPGTLVTRLKFDTSAAVPKLFFKAMRWLSDEEYTVCQTQGRSDDALKAITMSVAQMDGAKAKEAPVKMDGAPPKAAAKAPAKPVAQAEPEPQADAEEEEQAQPVVKKAAPAPKTLATGGKSKITEMLNQWDDE